MKGLAGIKKYEDKLNDLATHMKKLEQYGEEVNHRISTYSSDKEKIEIIEEKISNLSSMSDGIDSRIQELSDMNAEIKTMRSSVKKFQENITSMQNKFDKIEAKSESIDRVSESVDHSFEDITSLENRLKQCGDKIHEFEVAHEKFNAVMMNNGSINEAVDKLTSLESLINSTDEKIKKLNESKKGIQESEKRLHELYGNIDERMKLLHDITKEETSKKGASSPASKHISPSMKQTIHKLRKEGWSVKEIASRLKLEENLVEAILEFGDDGE